MYRSVHTRYVLNVFTFTLDLNIMHTSVYELLQSFRVFKTIFYCVVAFSLVSNF
jgi:hypothetical protein